MQGLLEDIRLARFRFDLECVMPLDLPPYKGSTFRGAFGITLKDVVCVQRQLDRCEPCWLRLTCVYPYLFETPNFKPEGSLLPPNTLAPQPIVLEPPLEEKTRYHQGELLSLHFVLIGKALDYLPYVIFVLTEMGRKGIGKGRGKFQVVAVTVNKRPQTILGSSGEVGEAVIYDGATRMISNLPAGFDRVNHHYIPDPSSVHPFTQSITCMKLDEPEARRFSAIFEGIARVLAEPRTMKMAPQRRGVHRERPRSLCALCASAVSFIFG